MDVVNKWITVVVLFMIAVLVVMFWKGGAGQYEFAIEKSTLFENHAVVYVLDTKDGSVQAKLVDENSLHYNNNPRNGPTKVFAQPSVGRRRY